MPADKVSEPQRSHLRKTSRKAPALKTAIIAKRVAGESKAQIARDLNIATNTVSSIIALSDIDRMLEDGRIQAHKMIPRSLTVIDTRLDSNDLDAAKFILSNTLFSDNESLPRSSPDVHLNQALAIYVDNITQSDSKIVSVSPESDNPPDKDNQS